MTVMKRAIERADVLDVDAFARQRAERRAQVLALKRLRRVPVGPHATFYFENYDTIWWQVHEMLRIEGGGEAQIADELGAYNPLVPKGRELVATLMFEIEDPVRRAAILGELGGAENMVRMRVGALTVAAVPEADVERTDETGKTSAVHFLHFPFTAHAIAAFKDERQPVVLAIDHPHYGHMASLPLETRRALAGDFTAEP
jgi:Protein of unknown function (DUF3501)